LLERGVRHLEIDSEGRRKLEVTRCERIESGMYMVDAPSLIKAMYSKN
jgi:hypothetical protein